jgi:hypothetical protein
VCAVHTTQTDRQAGRRIDKKPCSDTGLQIATLTGYRLQDRLQAYRLKNYINNYVTKNSKEIHKCIKSSRNGPVYAGIPYRNFFLFLNFISAIINTSRFFKDRSAIGYRYRQYLSICSVR